MRSDEVALRQPLHLRGERHIGMQRMPVYGHCDEGEEKLRYEGENGCSVVPPRRMTKTLGRIVLDGKASEVGGGGVVYLKGGSS